MGDGVNIAARLEGIAEPGAICLSEDAYRQVKGRLDLAVTDLGPTQLKNIAEPIRVYSLRSRRAGAGEACDGAKRPRSRPSRNGVRRSRRCAAGIVALLVLIAARRVVLPRRNRTAPVASNAPRRRGRASLHRGAALHKSLRRSEPGLFRRRHHRESHHRSLAHPQQLRDRAQHRLHLQGQEPSTPRRSARSLAFAMCSKARCSATRTGCASTPSSSTRNPARISGPTASRRTWPTCSSCKIRWWRDWPIALGNELVKAEAEKGARSKNPDAIDLTMRGWALYWQDECEAHKGQQRCGAGLVRTGAQDRPERRRCAGGRSSILCA